MRRTLSLSVFAAVMLVGYSWVSAQSAASALQGAWQIDDVTTPRPVPDIPVRKPRGLIMFSGRYFSNVAANTARGDFPEGRASRATADQLRTVWGQYVGETGTFEVAGSTLKWTRIAAKNPIAMAPGNFAEWTIMLNGDNLTMTEVRDQRGPIDNPVTIRLTRAK